MTLRCCEHDAARSQLQWRKLKSLKVTFEEVIHAVDSSDKKRFALLYIPASQPTESTTKATTIPVTPAGSGLDVEGVPTGENQASAAVLAAPVTNEEQAKATQHALSVKDSEPSHFLIRATQGHSIKSVDAASFLEPLTLADEAKLPDTVVHGTFHGAWPAILESGGLKCMGRNHVHFASGPSLASTLAEVQERGGDQAQVHPKNEKQVISGMRWDAQVLIYIDLRRALAAGCPFWRSENGVILSEGLPVPQGNESAEGESQKVVSSEFFEVVVERKAGMGKIWERGQVLQELPAQLTKRGNPKTRR